MTIYQYYYPIQIEKWDKLKRENATALTCSHDNSHSIGHFVSIEYNTRCKFFFVMLFNCLAKLTIISALGNMEQWNASRGAWNEQVIIFIYACGFHWLWTVELIYFDFFVFLLFLLFLFVSRNKHFTVSIKDFGVFNKLGQGGNNQFRCDYAQYISGENIY